MATSRDRKRQSEGLAKGYATEHTLWDVTLSHAMFLDRWNQRFC